jgi:hypothetical protein
VPLGFCDRLARLRGVTAKIARAGSTAAEAGLRVGGRGEREAAMIAAMMILIVVNPSP